MTKSLASTSSKKELLSIENAAETTDRFSIGSALHNNLLAFLDETGGYNLERIDPEFPVFVAATVLCTPRAYWGRIVPAVNAFREAQGIPGGVLHSREIRRQTGAFRFLRDPLRRESFYTGLSAVMATLPARFFIAAVHTQRHLDKYGAKAFHPYTWTLALTLERLYFCARQYGAGRVHVVAEARTETLDRELRSSFDHALAHGTAYVNARQFSEVTWELSFRSKRQNIVGTQLADLVGYPVARHVLDPVQSHRSMEVIVPKLLTARDGRVVGLKIVP